MHGVTSLKHMPKAICSRLSTPSCQASGSSAAHSCANWEVRTIRRNLEANYYGMHFRLLSMTDARLNLTQDFTFFRNLHKFHLLRVVQAHRPGMLQASHGGDG